MHKGLTIAVILSVALTCGRTYAVFDTTPDIFGVFLDQNANFLVDYSYPPLTVECYLAIVNPTFPEIYGWEAAIRSTNGEMLYVEPQVTGGGIVSRSGLEFHVEFPAPLATSTVTILATVTFLFNQYDVCLFLTGISSPALPEDLPLVWAAVDTPSAIQTTDFLPNGVDASIWTTGSVIGAPLPCEGAVASDELSWGAIKSLYR